MTNIHMRRYPLRITGRRLLMARPPSRPMRQSRPMLPGTGLENDEVGPAVLESSRQRSRQPLGGRRDRGDLVADLQVHCDQPGETALDGRSQGVDAALDKSPDQGVNDWAKG